MPIKDNSNVVTEKVQMCLEATQIGFAIAGLGTPIVASIVPLISLIALPFISYNDSLIKKQLKIVVDEFNKLETKVEKLEKINEEEKHTFLLNEYKFFDCCLKEKIKEKIKIYSKIFSSGINSGYAFKQDDIFDIQMDIINSLRQEDLRLCNYLIEFTKEKTKTPFIYEFGYDDVEMFIAKLSNEEETLNKYALKHLISLGLIDETLTSAEENTNGTIDIFKIAVSRYSLTQRFRMIYGVITSSYAE